MNISLTRELEEMVNGKIKSGMYTSASEVIREALRLLAEHDFVRKAKRASLQRDIELGLEEAENGELFRLDLEAIRREGKKMLERRKRL